MRSLIRYLVFLAILLAVTWIKIPQRYEETFPRNAGPIFNREVRHVFKNWIEEDHPEIVLLGDSTLSDGVDADLLSGLTDKRVGKFDVHGSASALWYLILKNNIVIAENPPSVVVILFRDTILTAPGYRVRGSYFTQLDEFAGRNEPLLLERSYLNLMNPVEKFAEAYIPLYGARGKIRQDIDSGIRYSLPGWLSCSVECTDDSMYNVFQAADLEPGQLQNAVATAEQYLYTPRQLNFQRQVDQSYLPEMIRLSKENNIQLILVRLKSGIGTKDGMETSSIKRYMRDLSEYLQEENVLLLDYGADPRLKSEYFKDPLHLSKKGETFFTQLLAEGLNNLLK